MKTHNKRIYIAQMLLDNKLLTQEQIDTALAAQKKTDKKIGQILVDLGYIEEDQLLKVVANQLHIEYVSLKDYPIDDVLFNKLSEFHARQFRAIVLRQEGNNYLVGMEDPQNLIAIDEIERLLQEKIIVALVKEAELLDVFEKKYKHSEEIVYFAESLSDELSSDINLSDDDKQLSSQDLPVVNLLRSIFERSIEENASDIHIEPDEHGVRIRLRIDGLLHEQMIEDKKICQAMIQRIKLMANLNIAEKRLPQDGRISITIKKQKLDVRISTIPIQYGESLVMRILNQSSHLLSLDKLGLPPEIHKKYLQTLRASYGLILIVGPTGSGKTTSLYASLNLLNQPDTKIITVEDPVEYRLSRVNQIQVNNEINLTFPIVLRAILRQDPDIVMIGEMRDKITLEIAIRAAMTGHLVFATLHTNDSLNTIIRLMDMGAESYLIASVLRTVLAQRLVRRICQACITDTNLTSEQQAWLSGATTLNWQNNHFKKGTGCIKCHYTGYSGRIGVYEFLFFTPELTDALRLNDMTQFNQLVKKSGTFQSLLDHALTLAFSGKTSIDEVIAMAGEV